MVIKWPTLRFIIIVLLRFLVWFQKLCFDNNKIDDNFVGPGRVASFVCNLLHNFRLIYLKIRIFFPL